MALISRPSGIASGTAPALLLGDGFLGSDPIIYVDSANANASDSNAGTSRERPKATVFGASGAISVCTDLVSNIVMCEATHRETISGAYTWAKAGITLISVGSGTARAQFTSSVAGVAITVSATDVRVENCYFPASTATTTSRFTVSAAGFEMRDCQLDMGATDTTDGVLINGVANCTIKGTTFKATARTTGTSQVGLRATGAATNLLVEDCTFDGGSASVGWCTLAGKIDTATADRFRLRNLTLQNYSVFQVSISGVKGYLYVPTCDVTSRVEWVE